MHKLATRSLVTVLFASWLAHGALFGQTVKAKPARDPQQYKLTASEEAFLEDLERRAFRFSWEHSDPKTGLTLDRAHTDGTAPQQIDTHYNVASIAATGF